MPQTHDRTIFHIGVEDTNTTILAQDIGRYPTGMNLTLVLEDMVARLTWIEANCGVAFAHYFVAQAYIDNGLWLFTADAEIHQGGSTTLPADAIIYKAGSTAGASSFTANAFLLEVC